MAMVWDKVRVRRWNVCFLLEPWVMLELHQGGPLLGHRLQTQLKEILAIFRERERGEMKMTDPPECELKVV